MWPYLLLFAIIYLRVKRETQTGEKTMTITMSKNEKLVTIKSEGSRLYVAYQSATRDHNMVRRANDCRSTPFMMPKSYCKDSKVNPAEVFVF